MIRRLLLALALLWPAAALAEDLAVGLTEDVIHITSSFTGAEIVLYGAIEAPDTYEDADERDIVVVVRGPEAPSLVRKRGRVYGVWLNTDEALFGRVPGYYHLASTKPLDRIAAPAVMERQGLGLANLTLDGPRRDDANEFEKALIRNKVAAGLFKEDPSGIDMNGPTLFQTRIRLPSNVPVGQYTAEAYLFRDGQVISAYSAPLYIDKSGIERTLFNFAHRQPAIYGIAAIIIAFMLGMAAAFVFRDRD